VAAMIDLRGRMTDERGLIGKIMILWLVLAVVLSLAAIDTAKILFARYKVADAAEQASFEAAATLLSSDERAAAYQAALDTVEAIDPGAKMTGFEIDPTTKQVTVTVTKKASTLVVGRLGFLKHLTKATATDTSEPPTL
jgi:Flp pilus assembly protein TadG